MKAAEGDKSQKSQTWSLTSYQLKWIAIVTMVIDHTGIVFFPGELVWRYIGRIAFPIFCFLLVEGFFHTHNIYQYMLRMGIFAVLSEIPYDLAFRGAVLEFQHQNVFFTLLLGLALMYVLKLGGSWLEKGAEVFVVMCLAEFLQTDYGFKGILLIFIYCQLREQFWPKLAAGAVWNFLWNGSIQGYGALAMIPIALYRGEQGRKMKYFFYIFYPGHLLVLYAASRLMAGL